MNDPPDIIFLENGKRVIKIAEVYFIILYFFTGNTFNAIENAWIGARVIVNGNYFIPIFDKINDRMRTDISAPAGYKNSCHSYTGKSQLFFTKLICK